jgi:hypothetical protein
MRAYVSQLHGVFVITLAVMVVALTLIGLAWLPSSGAFPAVTENVSVSANEPGVTHFIEELSRVGNGSALVIEASDLEPEPSAGNYTLFIENIGTATLCTPRYVIFHNGGLVSVPISRQHLGPSQVPETDGYSARPGIDTVAAVTRTRPGDASPVQQQGVMSEVTGSGFYYVRLCWASGGPVALSGSYLSAQLPAMDSFDSNPNIKVTRQLNPVAGDTANYVIQSISQPTSVTSSGWQWSGFPPSEQITLSAVNVGGTQHDSYLAFLSGIAFGVAGGALITLIQELLTPLSDRRRARRDTVSPPAEASAA